MSLQPFPYCKPCDHFHDESTCAIARRILESGKAKKNDQGDIIKELTQNLRDMQFNQAQLMKAMKLNQENHSEEMRSMHAKLIAIEEIHVEELSTIKENHKKEMSSMEDREVNLQNMLLAIEEQHDEEPKIMEINHSNQITTMQDHLITMEENHVKVINDMEDGHICLHIKLLTMEENHAKEINAMRVEHSNQTNAMKIEQITLHIKIQNMER